MLPLLFYHFERSPRGHWVFVAFLVVLPAAGGCPAVVAFDPRSPLKH